MIRLLLIGNQLVSGVQKRKQQATEFFFAEHHGEYFEMSVENIRAEIRESRDLKQDLQDIQDGIAVVHASDYEKQEQEKKKELRQERKNKNKDKLLKALTELGEDG